MIKFDLDYLKILLKYPQYRNIKSLKLLFMLNKAIITTKIKLPLALFPLFILINFLGIYLKNKHEN
jgi:hypothetical protein